MAQLNKNNALTGLLGNTVLRKRDNKTIVQSRPDSVRQTARTKEAGNEFRQCSSWAKWLRLGLRHFLSNETDGYMHSRFAGQLYNAIQLNGALRKGERTPLNSDLSTLGGFEFNTHSPFSDYFLPEISVELNGNNEVRVMVPAFNPHSALQFPKDTQQAELLVYVLYTNFEANTGLTDHYTMLPVPNHYADIAETSWTSPARRPPGTGMRQTALLQSRPLRSPAVWQQQGLQPGEGVVCREDPVSLFTPRQVTGRLLGFFLYVWERLNGDMHPNWGVMSNASTQPENNA